MKTRLIILLLFVLSLSVVGMALRGKEKKKDNNLNVDKHEKAVTKAGAVALQIPDGVSKIRIVDGTTGEGVILEGESISEFGKLLSSVAGVSQSCEDSTGYIYSVHCYRGEEQCTSFRFMTDRIVIDSTGDVSKRVTYDDANPAFAYIEEEFAKYR